MATNVPVTGETPITIKISIGEDVKKLKLPLKDLTADILPAKLISILGLPTDKTVTFDRFSDSIGGFITLDSTKPTVYKTLVRAAKAKLKLRLRAVVEGEPSRPVTTASQKPKVVSSDIMTRPEILSCLAKLPPPTDRPDAYQTTLNLEQSKGPVITCGRGKNVGAGIFEFRDAHTNIHTNVPQAQPSYGTKPARVDPKTANFIRGKALTAASSLKPDTPVSFPDAYNTNAMSFASECEPVLVFRRKSPSGASMPGHPTWSVYCNECDSTLNNEHFHCSICDGGDYDLCQSCVDSGKLCPGQGHWLIKRFVKDGMIISSSTERLAPKPKAPALPIRPFTFPKAENVVPGAFTDDARTLREDVTFSTRTCNSCVDVMNDDKFVTCNTCDDYDLCLKCHVDNKHGHHPGHGFKPAVPGKMLNRVEQALLAPGRRIRHAAICDGCEKGILGIRHKCFDCPDFDYCNDCVRAASSTHPGHRFAALYDRIAMTTKEPAVHRGVYCDGPACVSNAHQVYITGVRYKCVVCNDTDFCANCEALPHSAHNKTHPLIKIVSPISGLNVCTVNDTGNGTVVSGLGDRVCSRVPTTLAPAPAPAPAPGRTPTLSSASSVKTVAFIEPTSTGTDIEKEKVDVLERSPPSTEKAELQALFVCDTIPDGITVRGDARFTQVWTMRNPGPSVWPAGCSVRLTGGDNMLNVDRERPFSAVAMGEATESNIIGREVLPGEEVAFKVVMKAPSRNGRAISYWRLKTLDGTPFGHRLWCDIDVRSWISPPTNEGGDMASKKVSAEPATEVGTARNQYAEQLASKLDPTREASAAPSQQMRTLAERLLDLQARRQKVEPSGEEQKTSKVSESPMVFPTLEKESPSSSIHLSATSSDDVTATAGNEAATVKTPSKAATVEDESTGDVVSAAIPSASSEATYAESDGDAFDDISSEIELLSAGDEISDDDGFLTDEEYDILDASDQETIASSG